MGYFFIFNNLQSFQGRGDTYLVVAAQGGGTVRVQDAVLADNFSTGSWSHAVHMGLEQNFLRPGHIPRQQAPHVARGADTVSPGLIYLHLYVQSL